MKRSLLISSAFALTLSPAALAGEKNDRFSDDHAHIDAQVHTSGGENLGTVERVRFTSSNQSEIDAYVVETRGFLEIGGREILIDAGDAEWTGTGNDRVLTLDYTATQAASLPDFNENRATDYWLADAELVEIRDRADEAGTRTDNAQARAEAEADKREWAASRDRSDEARSSAAARTQTSNAEQARAERAEDRSEEARARARTQAEADAAVRRGEEEANVRIAADSQTDDGEPESAVRRIFNDLTGRGDDNNAWNRNVTAASWDIGDWTDSTVYLPDGDRLGTVSDVRTDADGISSLIVETGTQFDDLESELEVMIKDVVAVRQNGMSNEIRVASSVRPSSG